MYNVYLPVNYLAQKETITESPETFGNNIRIDENIETTNKGKTLL